MIFLWSNYFSVWEPTVICFSELHRRAFSTQKRDTNLESCYVDPIIRGNISEVTVVKRLIFCMCTHVFFMMIGVIKWLYWSPSDDLHTVCWRGIWQRYFSIEMLQMENGWLDNISTKFFIFCFPVRSTIWSREQYIQRSKKAFQLFLRFLLSYRILV